jgi:hypothetical protein
MERDASRVLMRMRQKLRGQEDLSAEALSIEGQVGCRDWWWRGGDTLVG